MPYVQNPKELLQKSPAAIQRVNQTDLNIRLILDAKDSQEVADQQAMTLVGAVRQLQSEDTAMKQEALETINSALPDSSDGRAFIYGSLGKMANMRLAEPELDTETLQNIHTAMSLVYPEGESQMQIEEQSQ